MRQGRWFAIAAAGTVGCTAVLGFPDRVPISDEIGSTPDAADVADVSAQPVADADAPPLDGGADTSVRDSGCGALCPVAAYDFEEGSGLVTKDKSGNKNDGTLIGATTFGVGKYGKALYFTGANDFVQVPAATSLDIAGTHLTIAFWAYVVDNQGRDHVLVNKAWMTGMMNAPYYQYGVEFNRGSQAFNFFLGVGTGVAGERVLGISATPTSTWTHVAFTYDGSMQRGYINGVMAGQQAATGSIVARGTALRMGVDGVTQQGFSGRLDAVRIYDRTLTIAEIVALRDGS